MWLTLTGIVKVRGAQQNLYFNRRQTAKARTGRVGLPDVTGHLCLVVWLQLLDANDLAGGGGVFSRYL